MNDYMCSYGNCHETDTPILVTDNRKGTRHRYCCAEHAAAGLIHNSRMDWQPYAKDRLTVEAHIEAYRLGAIVPERKTAEPL